MCRPLVITAAPSPPALTSVASVLVVQHGQSTVGNLTAPKPDALIDKTITFVDDSEIEPESEDESQTQALIVRWLLFCWIYCVLLNILARISSKLFKEPASTLFVLWVLTLLQPTMSSSHLSLGRRRHEGHIYITSSSCPKFLNLIFWTLFLNTAPLNL